MGSNSTVTLSFLTSTPVRSLMERVPSGTITRTDSPAAAGIIVLRSSLAVLRASQTDLLASFLGQFLRRASAFLTSSVPSATLAAERVCSGLGSTFLIPSTILSIRALKSVRARTISLALLSFSLMKSITRLA